MVGVSYENKGLEILIDILLPLPVYLKWANKCLLAQCSCHPYLTIYIFHILAHIIFRLISWGSKAVEAEPGGYSDLDWTGCAACSSLETHTHF